MPTTPTIAQEQYVETIVRPWSVLAKQSGRMMIKIAAKSTWSRNQNG